MADFEADFLVRRNTLRAMFALAAGLFTLPALAEQKFPDVLGAKITPRQGSFDFDVTISSPYDTPARYADAFRIKDERGRVFGERILLHDHASEQPFTRDLYRIDIPAGVRAVTIEARDRKYGYGGKTVTLPLPGR